MNHEESREILWNIPENFVIILYILSALTMFYMFYQFMSRAKIYNTAHKPRSKNRKKSISDFLEYIFFHKTIRRDPYAGFMHLFLFWGFVILLIATSIVAIQHHLGIEILKGTRFLIFSTGADLGGLAFCTGIVMALWRRKGSSIEDSRLQRDIYTTCVLYLLLCIGLSGFFLEGARIARNFFDFEMFSPIGYLFALLINVLGYGGEKVAFLHRYLWVFHGLLVLAFFLVLPVSIMRHIVLASMQVFRSNSRPGVLAPAYGPVIRETDIQQFSSMDLLQADACLTCGRCDAVCPAHAAGKPLKPRSIVQGIRLNMSDVAPIARNISKDALWSCTTCHACDAACPIHIPIVDKIVHLRRGEVASSRLQAPAANALESSAQKFNPFGRPNSSRMDWAQGLGVPVVQKQDQEIDTLYWIGCAGAFDPDGQSVSRSMVKILKHLKVSYKVLGCSERCSGDPARRMGEEGLWHKLSTTNLEKFAHLKVKKIITHCAHCFNSFKNEYPELGQTPEVVHHSEWLEQQIETGALSIKSENKEKLTYHDPCYLSRANKVVEAPRAILKKISKDKEISEMKDHGKDSFCCGGGGGQMWLDTKGTKRVEEIRASQVQATGATTAVTGCPFCKPMLQAGRNNLPAGAGKWQVKDIAQVVAENLS